MQEKSKSSGMTVLKTWLLIWGLGLAGQLCWNMENQWFNTFVYAKIAKNPDIINWMVAISAVATTFSTFFFGTVSDRRGSRRPFVAYGYIIWGLFTIAFGLTEFISKTNYVLAGVLVVIADMVMSFFGSMGNDAGFNAWTNDIMTKSNRGAIGAALATQPVIGTILGTVVGGMLVGNAENPSDRNYMLLFVVMGGFVILVGILSIFTLKDSPLLTPNKQGSFWKQFASVFNFKKFFSQKELVWVNIAVTVFFIAFNIYFVHLGNYMIYYLGFKEGDMGLIEGISLIGAMVLAIPATFLINKNKSPLLGYISVALNVVGLLILYFFVRPNNVDTSTIFNWLLILGVFFIGAGYVV
ncbi:MAG: MFS transporter, partial [Clostridia bacterium]